MSFVATVRGKVIELAVARCQDCRQRAVLCDVCSACSKCHEPTVKFAKEINGKLVEVWLS